MWGWNPLTVDEEELHTPSYVDSLVQNWGYEDLLPENTPIFNKVTYTVHIFVAVILVVLGIYTFTVRS